VGSGSADSLKFLIRDRDALEGHQFEDLGLEAAGWDARAGVPDPIAAADALVHLHPYDLAARRHPAADQFRRGTPGYPTILVGIIDL
jgi:hypothetical protein